MTMTMEIMMNPCIPWPKRRHSLPIYENEEQSKVTSKLLKQCEMLCVGLDLYYIKLF